MLLLVIPVQRGAHMFSATRHTGGASIQAKCGRNCEDRRPAKVGRDHQTRLLPCLSERKCREEAGSHRMRPSCAKTLSPGLTELSVGVERVASNHQGVDFAGPIEDLEGLAVPKQSLHAAAVVDAHGTEDLDRFDGVPHGRVGAE